MTINLKLPDIRELKPRITVFGVGGAGGNAVNNMITAGLVGCDFVVANTDAQALTRLFATHAAIALGHANERENLNEGLQTRKVIGQAIGILMERYKIDEDRAFAFLVRASSHGNIKLRAIAQELVDERNAQ